jgi:hypothetical protein
LDIEERGEDIDDWIVDDDGYADLEEGKGRGGVVVATKAQAAFGPGSTGMKSKKRYLGESPSSVSAPFSAHSPNARRERGRVMKAARTMADNSVQYDWSCRCYGSRDSSSHQR